MICKCGQQGIENQVLGNIFWYCRQCKSEIINSNKNVSQLNDLAKSILTKEQLEAIENQMNDIFRSMTSTGGL